jgi:poly(A) polymerase
MLRAVRFAARFGFDIEPETFTAIRKLHGLLCRVSAERIRDELSKLLVGKAAGRALKLADSTGITDLFLPELSTLKLEQDPVHKHKDVFHHTLAVVDRAEPTLEVRLAALLHDIGKPKTRRIDKDGVSFHHHEVEGSKMARERLRALKFPNEVVDAVERIIFLHHRFHTYSLGWSDSAVRRYVRDAGPLLGNLNALVRADCTTRNAAKAKKLEERMEELDDRIKELASREELERIRPDLDGTQIMAFLGVEPGKVVGEAWQFLLDLRLDEGPMSEDDAYERLDAWGRERGLEVTGDRVPPKEKKKGD